VDPYALIAQAPNAGEAFTNAFQGGMKQNALSSFAQNPSDPKAQGAAARYDPNAVMQYRLQEQRQQLAQQQSNHEEWLKHAGNLAKWADTPEKRNQAIDQLLATNHPDISTEDLLKLKSLPPEQWQAVRANFMAAAGVADDKPQHDTSSIQNFEYAQQHGYKGGFDQFMALEHPGMNSPVTLPYGATVEAPGQQAAPVTATGPNGQKVQLNPQTGQWEPMGGAGGNASGGFPR
jgi:hypothetical protein